MNSFETELDTLMGKWLGRGDNYESMLAALDSAKDTLAKHQTLRGNGSPEVRDGD